MERQTHKGLEKHNVTRARAKEGIPPVSLVNPNKIFIPSHKDPKPPETSQRISGRFKEQEQDSSASENTPLIE